MRPLRWLEKLFTVCPILSNRPDDKFRRTIKWHYEYIDRKFYCRSHWRNSFYRGRSNHCSRSIGLLPAIVVRDSPNSSHVPINLSESAKKFRVLGLMLVLLLYLTATFCLLQGLSDLRIVFHWEQWEAYFGSRLSDRAEIVLYSKFWIAIAIALVLIGFWAQRRLRRRST